MSPRGRAVARAAGLLVLLAIAACEPEPGPKPVAQAPAAAQSLEGADAIRRVVEAEKSCVYTGYKRAIHGEEGEGRATRMKVSRASDGRTLLDWQPGSEPGRRFEYANRFAWMDDPALLLRNYTVTLDPNDGPAVAWRETRHISVRGVRPGRPSLELYVDKETWLILRGQIRDGEGKLWLTTVFDTIEYREPDAPATAAPAEALASVRPAGRDPVRLPLGVTAAPDGFVRVGAEETSSGGTREDWSDGLAAFCVFEAKRTSAPAAGSEGELQRRSCSGRASVSGIFSGIDVTVVGNLPVAELEAVVRGLAPAR